MEWKHAELSNKQGNVHRTPTSFITSSYHCNAVGVTSRSLRHETIPSMVQIVAVDKPDGSCRDRYTAHLFNFRNRKQEIRDKRHVTWPWFEICFSILHFSLSSLALEQWRPSIEKKKKIHDVVAPERLQIKRNRFIFPRNPRFHLLELCYCPSENKLQWTISSTHLEGICKQTALLQLSSSFYRSKAYTTLRWSAS